MPKLTQIQKVRRNSRLRFTGKKLSDYINLGTTNFIGARHVINGTDHAGKIAKYAVAYDATLEQGGYSVM
ncbi:MULTISPECIES: hypothetical protein [Rhizobium]|uniref:Uncharacterized protein n=2 Tax=Rhizobium TaxID=379 RepID=A0A1S9GLG6_9HYPH|nr:MULTISPECIES: hypothetical protein [Rhizobium]MBB3165865.1 hypothetical protein [Rhizobium laguerreae]MBY5385411.1 hypothetical protein [Rhizobium leguminosarum]NEH46506.1 hypothetical protein [Rhizobium leguminosarum]NEH71092.1 hypothetical protein [Rhizobium leguminosarum]NEI02703.1 hypothetical protein [Rhizobium leguminosarum]